MNSVKSSKRNSVSRDSSRKKKVRICVTNRNSLNNDKKLFFYNNDSEKHAKLVEKRNEFVEKWVNPSGDLNIEKLENLIRHKENEIREKKKQMRMNLGLNLNLEKVEKEKEEVKEEGEKCTSKDGESVRALRIETDRLSSKPLKYRISKRNDSMPIRDFFSRTDNSKLVKRNRRAISPVDLKPFTYRIAKDNKAGSRKNSSATSWNKVRSSSKPKPRTSIAELADKKNPSLSDINTFIDESLAKFKMKKRQKSERRITKKGNFMFNTIGGSNEKTKKGGEKSSSISVLSPNPNRKKGQKRIRKKLKKKEKKKTKFDVSLPLLSGEIKNFDKLKTAYNNKCETERRNSIMGNNFFYGSRRFSERMNSMFSNRSWVKRSIDKVRISINGGNDLKSNIENINMKKTKKRHNNESK